MADVKVKVLSPVDHDGKRHEPGRTVTLPDEVADALAKAGAVEPVAEKTEKPAK
jgi:hypothetical protein